MTKDVKLDHPAPYEHFGPEMIHAMVILIVEQLNILHATAGLPAITKAQVETNLKTKFDELTADLFTAKTK